MRGKKINKTNKFKRTLIERAIYQTGKNCYAVIRWDKDKQQTRYLFSSNSVLECREYRDSNINFAVYGKGIQLNKFGRFTANIVYKSHVNKKVYSIYLGTFDTKEEASKFRSNFIKSLL